MTEDDNGTLWRRCEIAWMAHLDAAGYSVMRLSDLQGNTAGTRAPMLVRGGRSYRAPDAQTIRAGVTEFWEIKHRSRADVDPLTGSSEYWMEFASFRDYL